MVGSLALPPEAGGQLTTIHLPPEVWEILETYEETRNQVDQFVEEGDACFTTPAGERACVQIDPRVQELYREVRDRTPAVNRDLLPGEPGVIVIDVSESISVTDTGLVRGPVSVDIDDGAGVGDGGSVRPPAGIDVGETIGAGDEAETNDPVDLGIDEEIGTDETS